MFKEYMYVYYVKFNKIQSKLSLIFPVKEIYQQIKISKRITFVQWGSRSGHVTTLPPGDK